MEIHVTIPDGPMADALRKEAGDRCRSEANLILDYTRGSLIKRNYKIPKIRLVRGRYVYVDDTPDCDRD